MALDDPGASPSSATGRGFDGSAFWLGPSIQNASDSHRASSATSRSKTLSVRHGQATGADGRPATTHATGSRATSGRLARASRVRLGTAWTFLAADERPDALGIRAGTTHDAIFGPATVRCPGPGSTIARHRGRPTFILRPTSRGGPIQPVLRRGVATRPRSRLQGVRVNVSRPLTLARERTPPGFSIAGPSDRKSVV